MNRNLATIFAVASDGFPKRLCMQWQASLLALSVLLWVSGCKPPAPPAPQDSNTTSEAPSDVDSDTNNDADPATDADPVTNTDPDADPVTDADADHQDVAPDHGDAQGPDQENQTTKTDEPLEMELGDPRLTQGIPGDGVLTVDAIQKWLDIPENHRTIQPQLPQGLAGASANITGLDANPMTLAKIELGRQLYFDTRLSADATISCASCHDPEMGFAAHTQFGVGIDEQEGGRNSPVAYNRIVSGPQFWDGRAATLEAQAIGPIENPIEMGNTHEACVKTLAQIEGYRLQFEKIFGGAVTIENVGKAIATFERTLVTAAAPYDYLAIVQNVEKQWAEDMDEFEEEAPEQFASYQKAKEQANKMSASARRGAELFFTEKSNCTACHAGANFSDEAYHNLGVGMEAEKPDMGRFDVTKMEIDKGAFKTPTLRNVALTAPYMHDGSQKTLEEVVDWYAKGGHKNPFLSEKMKKLDLSDQDKADLVAFMKEGLTSDFPKVETGRLPE